MAVRFSSANSTYSVNINQAQGPLSVCTWFKLSVDRNGFSTVFSIDPGNDSGSMVVCQTDQDGTTLHAYPLDSGSGLALPLTVGTWYFLGISITGKNVTAKLRSQGAASFTTKTAVIYQAVNPRRLLIGNSSYDTSEYLNGCVASFRLWNDYALTEAELEAEYAYANPQRTANLTAFYKFDGPQTTDDSGNGYTLSGGTGSSSEPSPDLIEDVTPAAWSGWGLPIF